jgi:hypothetical protein
LSVSCLREDCVKLARIMKSLCVGIGTSILLEAVLKEIAVVVRR